MTDRRAVFFLIAAAACGALTLVADQKYRWLAATTSIAYVVFAFLSWLDHRGRS